MTIWKSPITIASITDVRRETMVGYLGIEFTEIGDDFLKGKMAVDRRTIQPYGIMHGGASCVLAETLGSVAGCHCIDNTRQIAVGLSINTSHIRMVREGFVFGTAKPIHLGKSTQVWEIPIVDGQERLVSLSRLTMSIIEKPKSS